MSDQQSESKIVVDEDWKSQVQAEKDALEKKKGAVHERDRPPVPPASFPLLIQTLATQAWASLGLFADPSTGQAEIDLDRARHFIDTLQVLEEKTQNNLTADEASLLEGLLHELRMAFVAVGSQSESAGPEPSQEKAGPSPIITP